MLFHIIFSYSNIFAKIMVLLKSDSSKYVDSKYNYLIQAPSILRINEICLINNSIFCSTYFILICTHVLSRFQYNYIVKSPHNKFQILIISMTIHKCKGCNKAFATEWGLSSHFQHRHVCKSIHYGIANQNIDLHDYTLQSKEKIIEKKPAGIFRRVFKP